MTTYKISAQQLVYFDFEIEAETEQEAIDEVMRIDNYGDIFSYVESWEPLHIGTIKEEK